MNVRRRAWILGRRANARVRGGLPPLPAGLLLVLLLVLVAVVGCGGDEESIPGTETTAAGATGAPDLSGGAGSFADSRDEAAPSDGDKVAESSSPVTTIPGGLGTAEQSLDRKVISNASLLIEVTEGTFQTTFDRAVALADKYGGYVVDSSASAAEGENVLRSGTITVRLPAQSFNQALTDAGGLGEVKSQNIDTQDVTEEYVDLEARLVNAQAQEKALLALMEKAGTINEILQVQQYLSQVQMEIEQLKGRLRFLDEHTSYSTITISIYESGTDVPDGGDWGFIDALKDALHAFVNGVNDIIVGLGGALPALIVLALVAYIGYRIAAPMLRRRREQREAGWQAAAQRNAPWSPGYPGPGYAPQGAPSVAPGAPAPAGPEIAAGTPAPAGSEQGAGEGPEGPRR